MKDKSLINKICKPFYYEMYQDIALYNLAAYTIQKLKENRIFINFENLAVALFLMFPKKFCMIGYEEYPDTNRIARSVNLQVRPKYQNLAFGNAKSGYSLTEKGKVVAKHVGEVLEGKFQEGRKKKIGQEDGSSKRTTTPKLEVNKKIINTDLYKKYSKDKNASIEKVEIYEFFKASPYTPQESIKAYLKSLVDIAQKSEVKDAIDFLKWIEKTLLPKIQGGKQ